MAAPLDERHADVCLALRACAGGPAAERPLAGRGVRQLLRPPLDRVQDRAPAAVGALVKLDNRERGSVRDGYALLDVGHAHSLVAIPRLCDVDLRAGSVFGAGLGELAHELRLGVNVCRLLLWLRLRPWLGFRHYRN